MRPSTVVELYCGPKPRTVICSPSPSTRLIDTPVTRCSESARLVSGVLADVFGRNTVDDAVGVFLDIHRALQRRADARDDDNGRIVLGRRCRGGAGSRLRHGRTRQGNDRQGRYAAQNRTTQKRPRFHFRYNFSPICFSLR